MAKKAAATGRKPRQQHIPGTEPPSVPEIDKAAEEYVEARDLRMGQQKIEITRQDTLLRLMKEHKLMVYEYDGKVVTIKDLEKVKVKRAKSADSNGDGGEED
jgi:hypothetical protein